MNSPGCCKYEPRQAEARFTRVLVWGLILNFSREVFETIGDILKSLLTLEPRAAGFNSLTINCLERSAFGLIAFVGGEIAKCREPL